MVLQKPEIKQWAEFFGPSLLTVVHQGISGVLGSPTQITWQTSFLTCFWKGKHLQSCGLQQSQHSTNSGCGDVLAMCSGHQQSKERQVVNWPQGQSSVHSWALILQDQGGSCGMDRNWFPVQMLSFRKMFLTSPPPQTLFIQILPGL